MNPDTTELSEALTGLLEANEEALKVAAAAEQEVARLRTELARKDRVLLEKVANAPAKVRSDAVANLVANLVQSGTVKHAYAQTLTEQLMADPNKLVELATSLSTISMPAPAQGVGIAKEASDTEKRASSADAEWDDVIRHGA